MSNIDEEEEQESSGPRGRPNAWFAQFKRDQEDRAARLGFGADYRAVPQPKAGSQNVKADQTIGSYSLCWCQLPEGHDWPGKAHGRRHPQQYTQEELVAHTAAAAQDTPHITRSDLRGFGDNYTDLIVKAVNDYGTRYRLNNKGIILYPQDGTDPYSLPMRENARTLKAVRIWFARHIADLDAETKKAKAQPQTDADIAEAARKLAARHNSPEHPVPAKPSAKKATARKAAPAAPTKEEPVAAATVPEPEVVIAPWLTKFDLPTRPLTEGWFHVENYKGETNPYAEVKDKGKASDTYVRCLVLLDDGTPCHWEATSTRAATGHFLAKHDPEHAEALYGKDAMERKVATRSGSLKQKAMVEAIETIAKVAGLKVTFGKVDKVDTSKYEKQIADLIAERDDLQARLGLLQEAFRGL